MTDADFTYTFGIGWRAPSNRLADILDQVSVKYGLSVADLKGPERFRRIAHPRQEAMWRMHQTGRYSLTQIGRFLGNRDHTTVLYGIRQHAARLEAEKVAA